MLKSYPVIQRKVDSLKRARFLHQKWRVNQSHRILELRLSIRTLMWSEST